MAIFDHYAAAGAVEEPGPQIQVQLRATAVQLHGIEAEDREGGNIALVHGPCSFLLLFADAVIPVPPDCQSELVAVSRHAYHVWKTLCVNDRDSGIIMVVVPRAGATLLPVVVQTHVAIAEVAQRGGHAVHRPLPCHHGIHDGLDQRLVHIRPEQIPRAPTHGRSETQAVVDGLRGWHQEHRDGSKEKHDGRPSQDRFSRGSSEQESDNLGCLA
mmetsp:Transcript_148095/g.412478  ORF Transcript_148095/g.412478 Transcript_148095/m.412478 type:complete len:214 (+) Transcript_148095:203-844(+)